MLHPDPTFTYHLARQHQHDLASKAEWERLARMARTASANRRRRPSVGRLAAAWQRLSHGLAHLPATPKASQTPHASPRVVQG
jgi:hypothetical protein